MPHLTTKVSVDGPVLDVWVGASKVLTNKLASLGKKPPAPVKARMLIDTGAGGTCFDASIMQALGLEPTGVMGINTPNSGPLPLICYQYDVKLSIPHDRAPLVLPDLPAIALNAHSLKGIQGLLGRDVLAHCLFFLDGTTGSFTLGF